MGNDRKICVGVIQEPHGLRGLVRLRSFTDDPLSIFDYKPLTDDSGERTFVLQLKNAMKDHFVGAIDGVNRRTEAEALKGQKLFVALSALPKPKKAQFYIEDLIGLEARGPKNEKYGKVMAVHDHGAGVFLEIGKTKKDSFMLPFRDAFIPDVDVASGSLTVMPPDGWLTADKPQKEKDHGRD